MSEDDEMMILLEKQANWISKLEEENARLRAAIKETCTNCWYGKATDPAQCRLCGLREMKGVKE